MVFNYFLAANCPASGLENAAQTSLNFAAPLPKSGISSSRYRGLLNIFETNRDRHGKQTGSQNDGGGGIPCSAGHCITGRHGAKNVGLLYRRRRRHSELSRPLQRLQQPTARGGRSSR